MLGCELLVEIFAAIDMAGIALVVIIARVASKPEGIVTAGGVANHLYERLLALIEGLGVEAVTVSERVVVTSNGCSLSLVELARREALKIAALASGDVDDLDVISGAHEIGLCGRVVDANILQWVGERFRQAGECTNA